MGHRKHSSPRRGSLAFAPRARHQTLIPRVRNWTSRGIEKPSLAGFPAFKAAMAQVITLDDREKTPNFGKPLFNPVTILSAPAISVYGFRGYSKDLGRRHVAQDVYADNLDDVARQAISLGKKGSRGKGARAVESRLAELEKNLDKVNSFTALVGVVPDVTGLPIKQAQVQEIGVSGGDIKGQFEYLKSILGKTIRAADLLKPGAYVDTIGVTKGKGFEGVITRFGVKRKQHKSRKTVREVGVISPWHPATVMYTVPRAGQMGFHQRVTLNNKVLAVADSQQMPITPSGGFPHFGEVRGEYVLLRGSVPGPIKRLVDIRLPLYPRRQKVQPPKIVELNIGGKAIPLASSAGPVAQPSK
ncbi:MAG TPA: 50S ribosomal protein L3 [Nitrososphaerales archaeon]|nr:50S ribosomal protein L3 [Nitrososphaerales archaeon]